MSEPIVGAIYAAEVGGYRLIARDHEDNLFSVSIDGKGVWGEKVVRANIADESYVLAKNVELRVVPKAPSIDLNAVRAKLTELADRLGEIPDLLAAMETSLSEKIANDVAAELRELETMLAKEES